MVSWSKQVSKELVYVLIHFTVTSFPLPEAIGAGCWFLHTKLRYNAHVWHDVTWREKQHGMDPS